MKEEEIAERPLFSRFRDKNDPFGGRSGKVAKIVLRAYLLALIAFITGLYLYALVCNLLTKNVGAILNALFGGFPIAVFDLILIFSAFGLWKKLFKKFSVRKKVEREIFGKTDAQEGADGKEPDPKGKGEAEENAREGLCVYRDFVRIARNGTKRDVPLCDLKKVKITRMTKESFVSFVTDETTHFCVVQNFDGMSKKFEKLFPCPVEVEGLNCETNSRRHVLEGGALGGVFMALFALAAGVVVIVLHYKLSTDIPVFLGAFFVIGGIIVLLAVLGHTSAWCNQVALPVAFCAAFSVFGAGFFKVMLAERQAGNLFALCVRDPYLVCLFGLFGVGAFLLVLAVVNAVRLIIDR